MRNPEKDPEKWTTGEEPMTGPQRSYLQTLCREAGEEFDEKLTKAEASKKIEELQAKTGRGQKEATFPLHPSWCCPERPLRRAGPIRNRGLAELSAVAGDASDFAFDLAGRGAIEVETSGGFLDVSVEQHPMGRVGLARSCLGARRPAIWPHASQHSRRCQKQPAVRTGPSEEWSIGEEPMKGCSNLITGVAPPTREEA